MNRKFGIELEISGISKETALQALKAVGIKAVSESYNHTTQKHWKIVPDASVSDGFEVVSPILKGESGMEIVEIAARALEDAGATANRSRGFHVHFDAREIRLDAMKNIIRRYARFEEEIDAFMPPSRRGNENRYCQSMKEIIGRNFEEASSIEKLIAVQKSRYYKVNLKSFQRHGTIEFRQHSGIANATKICEWIRFLAEFLDVCEKMENAAQAFPTSELPQSSQRFLELLSGDAPISLESVCEELGWLHQTARSLLSRLRKKGYAIKSVKENGKTLYIFEGGSLEDSLWKGISKRIEMFYRRRAAVLALTA